MPGGRRLAWVLVGLVFVLSVGVRLLHYHRGWERYRLLFFYQGRPLLVGLDSYYYLRLTRDLLTGHYERRDELRPEGLRPTPPPLLVCLTALLHRLTGLHPEWLAFFLPPVLGSFLVFPLFFWGRVLGGVWTGLLAALLGSTNYYWYVRTPLGRFDTDALLPVFVWLLSYAFWAQVRGRWSGRRALVVVSLTGFFYLWWWPMARAALPLALLWSYAGTYFLVSDPSARRRRLLAGLLPLVFLPLVWFPGLWPFGGRAFLEDLHRHLFLLLGLPQGPFKVGISELQGVDLAFLSRFLGHPVLLILALVGLGLVAWRAGASLFVLLFPLALAVCGLVARRFLIYLVPFYALGLAALVTTLATRGRCWKVLAGLLALLVVGLNARFTVEKTVSPKLNRWHAELAATLSRTPPETVVWCWWDYGYFVQYYARRQTVADGGSQGPYRVLMLSVPLAESRPRVAAAWMRYFAGRSPLLLARQLARQGPGALARLAEGLDLRSGQGPPVALFLPFQMLGLSSWVRAARVGQGTEVLARFLTRDFVFDPRQGRLRFRARGRVREVALREVNTLLFTPWPVVQDQRLYPHANGAVLYRFLQVPFAFLFDQETARTLAVQILLRQPRTTPPFALLSYKPLQGGVWMLP